MLSDVQFNFFLLFIYGWVFIIFRYAVVGVMEEFETSLEVLQVQYICVGTIDNSTDNR